MLSDLWNERSMTPILSESGRSRSVAETLELTRPYLRQAGITRVAQVTGLDESSVFVFSAIRPLSASLSVTQGKGTTLESARASAILEAMEHFHAETIEGQLRLSSFLEFSPDQVVDWSRLPGRLPRFSEGRRLLWQRGVSLLSRREVWVPFDLVHYDLRCDGPAAAPSFVPTSNGLASGNSLAEATTFALLEVIERHCTDEFFDLSVTEQEWRRVDTSSITDPECRRLLADLKRAEVVVSIWDLSDASEIPCFFCEALSAPNSTRNVLDARGFACHPDANVALNRAICEAVQSRLTWIAGARDDKPFISEQERRSRVTLAQEQWALRERTPPPRRFVGSPVYLRTFEECASWLSTRVMNSGFAEPVVVDLSKRGWPIHVVRVLVPGMRFETGEDTAETTS